MPDYLTEYRKLAGLKPYMRFEEDEEEDLDEKVKERSGTKMVFGKLRKLKKGLQKNLAKSDRQQKKFDKVGDKLADIAAKRGGRLGHIGAAAYHANIKGTGGMARAAVNLAAGRRKAAAHHAKTAVTGLRKAFGHAVRAASTG